MTYEKSGEDDNQKQVLGNFVNVVLCSLVVLVAGEDSKVLSDFLDLREKIWCF